MRVVFAGTPESAVPSLAALAGHSLFDIALVLTQPTRGRVRGRGAAPSPVRRAAEELGVPVLAPERLRDVRGQLEEAAPDVVAVVAYGQIFRRWLLELPPLGCVNVHFSLLPRHRGPSPVAWAILCGDRETGVTTIRMDRGVDTGPVLLTDRTPIGEDETTGILTERLAEMGGTLLVRTLEGVSSGAVSPVPQPDSGETHAPRLEKRDGLVDWNRPAEELARRVRALRPWPGAHTTFRGRNLKLHRVCVVEGSAGPGELQVREGRPLVGAGAGCLELLEAQTEGKGVLGGAEWIRGARPRPGERLGAEG